MSEMRTMADDVDTEERTNGGVIPGLTREARDDRVHVWITPSFTVHSGPNELRGRSLSLEGFEVEDTSAAANIKKAQKFTMRFDVGGFCLEVKVKAEPTAAEPGQSGLVFGFTDIGAGEKDALRRFIRAHISGHVVTADDIIRRQNMPTHVRGSSARNNPRSVPGEEGLIRRTVRRFVNMVVTLAVITLVLFVGGFALYERLTMVQSRFASVTAPSVNILAPADGRLAVSGPASGASVTRDQELVRIENPELDADLIRAQALARTQGGAIARAELAAAELQVARNTIYAPCDCQVLWAPEDGAHTLAGDQLYTLVRTTGDDLRVEALVHVGDVDRLFRGQPAYITWPETGDIAEGTVEYIALDTERQARAGFPDWMRQDQSLVSVMVAVNEPVDASLIGHPVDVVMRTDLTFMERVNVFFETLTTRPGDLISEEDAIQQDSDGVADADPANGGSGPTAALQ